MQDLLVGRKQSILRTIRLRVHWLAMSTNDFRTIKVIDYELLHPEIQMLKIEK